MIPYKCLLSTKQKQDIVDALQTGSRVHIKPTKTTQQGNGFGTILASLGISLAIEAIKKITGKGAPRLGRSTSSTLQIKQDGRGAPRLDMYEPPPPFIGTWEQMRGITVGMGEKKQQQQQPGHQKRGKARY